MNVTRIISECGAKVIQFFETTKYIAKILPKEVFFIKKLARLNKKQYLCTGINRTNKVKRRNAASEITPLRERTMSFLYYSRPVK